MDHKTKEQILSVGIDIGTSTTKLVISQLTLVNTAGTSHVPRIAIIDKQVLYKSPIYCTPLSTPSLIDMERVLQIVETEYEKANIEADRVQTGAVIITGETATKQNAKEMIHQLSEHAGEFLVATAGPDLEGIIAAKGSGVYQYSKETGKCIANIDIGGGTTNIAVFKAGQLIGTCTLHIGGRLIEFSDQRIASISPPVKNLCENLKRNLVLGDSISTTTIHDVLQEMVSVIHQALAGTLEPNHVLLLGHPPPWQDEIEAITFSGGVSECIYHLEKNVQTQAEPIYQDIGKSLAKELVHSTLLKRWEWVKPLETVRATVLGAGMQTTEISGSTIQVDPAKLPVKNLPVFQISLHEVFSQSSIKEIREAVRKAVHIYDSNDEGNNFALYLTDLPLLRFDEIQTLAHTIIDSLELQKNKADPIVIVVASDFAKVLGQSLQALQSTRPIICIDQISVEQGDYIDIGKVLKTKVVPVVVKTLAFQHT